MANQMPNSEQRIWSLKERLRAIRNGDHLSDCRIVLLAAEADDGVVETESATFNCHRIFLDALSPLFRDSLHEDAHQLRMSLETGGKKVPEIRILPSSSNYASRTVVEKMLDYAYLDEIDTSSSLEETLELLGFALTYEIRGLPHILTTRLLEKLDESNALRICSFASSLVQAPWAAAAVQPIWQAALEMICKNGDKLVESQDFLDLPESTMLEILQRDELQLSGELKLYQAVKRWGELHCKKMGLDPAEGDNLRTVLRNLIPHIRFPLMDPEEFTLNVGVNNVLLSMEDMVAILLYFTVPLEKRGVIPPGRFKSAPRRGVRKLEVGSSSVADLAPPKLSALEKAVLRRMMSNQ